VVAISTRGYHNLALKSDGTVVAWGLDNDLQAEVPANLTRATAVAAGGNHSLALKSDGTVVAWGLDTFGEIDVPAGLSDVIAIAAGSRHSMALKRDQTVVVWGNPGFDITVPAGLSGVVAISAGRFYNLALKSDGTVVAWGDNSDGQTNVPPDWTNMVKIAAGGFHNLGLRADGAAAGFGLDDAGQADTPANLANVVAIAAGTSHSLAIVSAGLNYDPSGEHVRLAITSPAANTLIKSASLTARGSATSTTGVYDVFYQLNGGNWASASSTDNYAHWSAELSLAAGTNLLQVYAVDSAGYGTATNSVSFRYKPSFLPNPYAAINGTLTGLFYSLTNDTVLDAASSGALTLKFTRKGSYSGKLSMLSGASSLSGKVHLDGNDTNMVVVPIAPKHSKLPSVTGALQIDLANPSQVITGALQQVSGTGDTATTRTLLFEGQMVRAGKANADKGVYNFNLDPQEADAGPLGGSFGRAAVGAGNTATVTLNLADQKGSAAVGTAETMEGLVPVFARLYRNKGLASGWLQITNGSILGGSIVWYKAANASGAFYPQGFLQTLSGAGSLYKRTTKANVVQATTGTLSLSDEAGISSTANLTVAKGTFSVPKDQNTNAIAFSIGPANGLLSGSFIPIGSKKRLGLKGLLISTNANTAPFATGYFVGTNRTGNLLISFQ
jgi:hypothetical protein